MSLFFRIADVVFADNNNMPMFSRIETALADDSVPSAVLIGPAAAAPSDLALPDEQYSLLHELLADEASDIETVLDDDSVPRRLVRPCGCGSAAANPRYVESLFTTVLDAAPTSDLQRQVATSAAALPGEDYRLLLELLAYAAAIEGRLNTLCFRYVRTRADHDSLMRAQQGTKNIYDTVRAIKAARGGILDAYLAARDGLPRSETETRKKG